MAMPTEKMVVTDDRFDDVCELELEGYYGAFWELMRSLSDDRKYTLRTLPDRDSVLIAWARPEKKAA